MKTVPKLKWMALTLILPEFLLGRAYQEWLMAYRSRKEMQQLNSAGGFEWTLAHAFYANMGGFMLECKKRDQEDGSAAVVDESAENAKELAKNVDIYYLNAGAIVDEIQPRSPGDDNNLRDGNSPKDENSPIHGNSLRQSLLSWLPDISEDVIEEKSKGDFFVKATALIQVLWLIIQVIVRASRGLVISQLEFAVIAYAACFIITYGFWWSKPQDAQISHIFRLEQPVGNSVPISSDVLNRLEGKQPRSWFAIVLRWVRYVGVRGLSIEKSVISKPPPNDARYDEICSNFLPKKALLTAMDDGFIIGGLVFGALHCAAWNSPFPTPVERLLWRIASVVSAGVLLLYYFLFLCRVHVFKSPPFKYFFLLAECMAVLGYILARLYLLVEMFRTLGFLPPEAFTATWSSQIPHVA